jgi:glycosyltransferase involved in cell wall biosynthesis
VTASRVLLVSTYPPRRCGIGAYAAAQAERLRSMGNEVVVLSPPDGDGDVRAPFVGGAALRRAAAVGGGFERIVVHFETGIWFRPRSPVTHVLTAASLLWLSIRRPRLEILVHEAHAPTSLLRPDYAMLRLAFGRAALRFHTAAEREGFERAYHLRTRSEIVDHAEGVALHASMGRPEARERLGLRGEGPVFVCPGFIQPDKAFERAIRAFGAAGATGWLYVVGSVREPTDENLGYARKLRALCERSHDVRMIEGYVADEDFDAWVIAADAVVLPYRSAWSSGALARAQRLGTPAFVSTAGGLAEQAGERDRTFASDDELAELFREAMRTPARRARRGSTRAPGGGR